MYSCPREWNENNVRASKSGEIIFRFKRYFLNRTRSDSFTGMRFNIVLLIFLRTTRVRFFQRLNTDQAGCFRELVILRVFSKWAPLPRAFLPLFLFRPSGRRGIKGRLTRVSFPFLSPLRPLLAAFMYSGLVKYSFWKLIAPGISNNTLSTVFSSAFPHPVFPIAPPQSAAFNGQVN